MSSDTWLYIYIGVSYVLMFFLAAGFATEDPLAAAGCWLISPIMMLLVVPFAILGAIGLGLAWCGEKMWGKT